MKRFSLFLLDIAVLFGSLIITLLIRYDDEFVRQYHFHLTPFGIIFGLWLIIFYIANLYDFREFRNTLHFYSLLLQTIIIASMISVAFFYLIPAFGITPKTNLFIFIVISSALLALSRWLFNVIVETKFRKSLVIVGLNEQALELARFIEEHPALGYNLRHMIDIDSDVEASQVSQIIHNEKIDTIVISPEAYRIPDIIDTFYKSLEQKIKFYNLATFYERLTGQVPLGSINQIWFLENLSEGTRSGYEIVKRTLDIIFAFIFGAVSLVFYPFIILVIKLSSPGPVFYIQKRIGGRGKIFKMVKFRTMIADAEKNSGAVWAADGDGRVTAVGKFLRRTRIDELPQIWNILKGEMSLVGPRAERPEFHSLLKKEVPFYEERYLTKPGLSGWAQINFRYGSSVKDAAEKLKYDLFYIKNRSLILDVGIVLKTIRIALQQAGR